MPKSSNIQKRCAKSSDCYFQTKAGKTLQPISPPGHHRSFPRSIFSISSEVPKSMRSLSLWNIRLLQKCARLLLARGTWVLSQVSFLNLMHFMRLSRNLSVSTGFLCCS